MSDTDNSTPSAESKVPPCTCGMAPEPRLPHALHCAWHPSSRKPDTAACVRCGNTLGPGDFFEDDRTRPYVIHNSDEPDERKEGPLCVRCFRIVAGLGIWHECPTCGGRGKVREEGT